MPTLLESVTRLFTPVKPLSPGIFHYQAPSDSPVPYRLHLRIEPDGNGMLIVNASTILHLNQTAVEFAYHLIKQTPEEQMLREITGRYRVNRQNALQDFQLLQDRIQALISSPDVDPETYLDFERSTPHTHQMLAPIRLDCALTYRLPATFDDSLAPNDRVRREMSTEEWCGIFDKAWSFGIPHVIFTGGEPTQRNDLPDLITHLESNGQVVGLISDGLKLIDNYYLQSLLQTGLDHLMITLTPDDEIAWKALENVLAADLFVSVHITLTPQVIQIIQNVMQRLVNLGVKSISLTASDPGLQNTLIQARNQAASLGLSLVWDLPVPYSAFNPVALETQIDDLPLGAGHTWLYIEPDGDILPAQGINQVLGNILTDPWEKLWQ
jgi:citrate lyase gamma subunit